MSTIGSGDRRPAGREVDAARVQLQGRRLCRRGSANMNKAMADVLVHTGPGTPMGNLLRRYWVPVLLSSEIAEPDGPQVRVQIMGEKLLAFRDTSGEVGLIGEFCSHRGVSLYFGRNEENGIRCA